MEYTGGKYSGDVASGRFDGHGTYTFPDGSKYVGQFKQGMFHGKGVIHTSVGSYSGVWENGKEVSGEFAFKDGLAYKEEGWSYCTPSDRRFYTEIVDGIKPAGECQTTNDRDGAPPLPEGCYDAGDGFYDPKRGAIFKYGTQREEVRRPGAAEMKWLVSKCRVGTSAAASTDAAAAAAPAAAE